MWDSNFCEGWFATILFCQQINSIVNIINICHPRKSRCTLLYVTLIVYISYNCVHIFNNNIIGQCISLTDTFTLKVLLAAVAYVWRPEDVDYLFTHPSLTWERLSGSRHSWLTVNVDLLLLPELALGAGKMRCCDTGQRSWKSAKGCWQYTLWCASCTVDVDREHAG